MKQLVLILFTLCSMLMLTAQNNNSNKVNFDRDWKFHEGDIAFPMLVGHDMTYNNAKAGVSWGAAAPVFDDSNWRKLNLPHDWAVEQPFDSTANVSQGFKKRGFGWYRKEFAIDMSDKGKHFELQFDGIATYCTIWLNGTVINRNFCGYNSIYIDVTPFLNYGTKKNVLAVRVDANQMEGWWYEGAGIYRHTWLVKRNPVHIITDGVFANPVKVNDSKWTIPGEVTLYNSGENRVKTEVIMSLYDKAGKLIQTANIKTEVDPLKKAVTNLNLDAENPTLWSLEKPYLYKVKTIVLENGVKIDSVTTTCGFRTIRFDANTGFYLNDKPLKLKGVCNHQDHAGVGVAVPDALWEYRIRKLKEFGSNAYRCAHNPPATEFLDACDSLGLLVMDENRIFNVIPEYANQLEWMVRRDRNRPSVILWSVFNEEPMQGSENGYEMVRRMTSLVKSLDTTRPVTAAANGGLLTPKNVAHAVDVIGMNYQPQRYDSVHSAFPNTPITSSEDGSAYMIRGVYTTDKTKCTHGSYDDQPAIWGETHRNNWKLINERPFIAGSFNWTGFDYRGEPQPYEWPAIGASFGILDQCGFPKAAYYIRQAQWLDSPVIQLIPHWNWPKDSIGKTIKVMALTNAEKVKLLLNGKVISEKVVDKYMMVEWKIPYKPGKLEAIGYFKNKAIKRSVVQTTGEAVALQLIPNRNWLNANGTDALPVTVQAVDSKGLPVPVANNMIEFEITGGAKIIGLGNGNPNSHEPEKGNMRSLFNGLAQVIIQSDIQSNQPIVLTAKSKGLKPFSVKIESK